MDRGVRFFWVGIGIAVLAGCGGGGSSQPMPVNASSQMLIVQNNDLLTQDLSGTNSKVVATSKAASYSAISPDGRTVVIPTINETSHKFDVSLMDSQTGAIRPEFTAISQSSLAMSPDSMALAFIDGDHGVPPQIKTVNRLTGATTDWGPAISDMLVGSGLAWDPSNRYMAVPQQQNSNLLLISRAKASTPIIVGHGTLPAFSPTGTSLAYVTGDGNVGIYNLATHANRFLNTNHKVETIAFSRDGGTLLATAIYPTGEGSFESHAATISPVTGELTYLPVVEGASQPVTVLGAVVK